MKVLKGLKQGLIFVISAPAGTGKTTLIRMLTKEFDCVVQSVSYTTREIRRGETEGRDYRFITEEEFEKRIEEKDFLEYARVFGHYYGTSKERVQELLNQGKHVALVIDTQGAAQIKKAIEAIYVFIRPPSLSELKRRLQGRKSETPESIETRLSWAEKEIQASRSYDYVIVNENLKMAYEILRAIFIAEEHKNRSQ